MAHDFNNLLMVITGYSHMLLDAMHPSDPARQDLEQVVKASERATDLTRQLLAFSRRQGVRASLVNLNALVQEMDRMLRRVLGEEIELTVRLAPELKAVRADPGQIEQVILNMVVNARDAMPSGGRLLIETRNSRPPCADSVIISDHRYRNRHGLPGAVTRLRAVLHHQGARHRARPGHQLRNHQRKRR